MACYHPIPAYYREKENGKKDIVFVDSNELPSYSRDGVLYYGKLDIPCGQCIGCRLEYSRQWAIRCVLEAMEHSNNYFITITYDDEHLPDRKLVPDIDTFTGEFLGESESSLDTLCPSDLRLFIKNLRRQLEYHYNHTGLRVYYCGEYGSKSARPHYHCILFNCPSLNDLVFYKYNHEHSPMYNSNFLDKIWKKGYIVVAEVNYNTCAYVARYMLKKQKGKNKHIYSDLGIEAEFSGCSRRPGIARGYYDVNKKKIFYTDELFITDSSGNVMKCKPPKYYDRLYDVDNPEDFKLLKEKRQASAENMEKITLSKTSLSKKEYLSLKEGNKFNSIKLLSRSL